MNDIVERLEERAASYEQSGPSAHHTAALLREAANEISHLRGCLEQIKIICIDNAATTVRHDLALEFVGGIAKRA